MKGKLGIVVGLGVGYVLGTRAGRERYEQIKTQWLKIWHLDPVQKQVERAKGYVGDKVAAVPGAVWTGVVKVVKAAGSSGTPGERLDSAIKTGSTAADDIEDAVEEAADEVATKVKKQTAASKTSAAKSSTAKKQTSSRSSSAKKTTQNGE